MPEIDLGLDFFLSVIRQNYFFKGDSASTYGVVQKNFQDSLFIKKQLYQKWLTCSHEIKIKSHPYKIRDFGFLHYEPSFRCQLTISEYDGFHILISLLCPYFGYYYCDFRHKTTNAESSIISLDSIFPVPCVSYFPYSLDQEKIRDKTSSIILKYFPEYKPFPSQYSKAPISDVYLNGLVYQKVELFQLLFSLDVHVLI